jgi:hypothetical protein
MYRCKVCHDLFEEDEGDVQQRLCNDCLDAQEDIIAGIAMSEEFLWRIF